MFLSKIENALHIIEKRLLIVVWIALLFITLMVVVDVFMRYVLDDPLPATVEMSTLIMPIVVFPGLAYTLFAGGHVRVSIFADRMPQQARYMCQLISLAAGLFTFGILTFWGWQHFWNSFVIREEMLAAIPLPWYVGKASLPLGAGLMSAEFLVQLVLIVVRKISVQKASVPKEAVGI